jgi:hypothetical protein
MKTTHLAAGAAVLLAIILAVILWRQSDLSDEVALLRAALENQSRPAATPAPPSAEPVRDDAPRSANTPSEPVPYEERIADLERVVNAQADIIEDLLSRLGGMELSNRKAAAPAWSALQVVGAPDSGAGDQRTAWAPSTEDGGQEWLQVEFPNEVEAATAVVRENCAPGCIIRINAVTDAGSEVPLWQGDAPKVSAVSNTPFALEGSVLTKRLKIYLDTKKVPGWNEIDAVQLIGRDGTRQWASNASASSSYGGGSSGLQLGDGGTIDLYFNESRSLQRGNVHTLDANQLGRFNNWMLETGTDASPAVVGSTVLRVRK